MDLFLHSVFHSEEHGASTGEYDILEKVSPDIIITFNYAVMSELVDTVEVFVAPEHGVKEKLWALNPLFLQVKVLFSW